MPAPDDPTIGGASSPVVEAAPSGQAVRGFFWRRMVEPVKNPTGKQKEAYARFLHTLSAACFIGATTVAFSGTGWEVARLTIALIVLGVVLFLVAAPLAKGDT